MSLWESGDVARWTEILSHAEKSRDALERMKAGYAALDKEIQGLGERILERSLPHVTKEELILVVSWKLKRGTWRPKLLDYAKSHSEQEVIEASSEAFQHLATIPPTDETVCKASTALCKLKGVGPATASLMLSLVSSSCPFMSDEALNLTQTPRDYTLKSYMMLRAKLTTKADLLNQAKGEIEWTPVSVERALWSSCHMTELKPVNEDQVGMPVKKKARR